MTIPELIGLVGTGCVLACYLLVQAGQMSATSIRFQLLNMLGCLLILYSLVSDFNLPSAVIQIAWFLISFYGLVKNLRRRTST